MNIIFNIITDLVYFFIFFCKNKNYLIYNKNEKKKPQQIPKKCHHQDPNTLKKETRKHQNNHAHVPGKTTVFFINEFYQKTIIF